MKNKKETIVIGHKNPDTDSICSAIAYANLKNKISDDIYVPKRAGEINGETKYILERLSVPVPDYIPYVGTQVGDIDIRRVEGVSPNISLKKAYTIMKEKDIMTLAVTEGKNLIGLITIGDVATSDMDVYDNRIISKANTQYKNIVETLEGTIVVGSEDDYFNEGKVIVGAASPNVMEEYISEHDMVILGNRFEAQFLAMEMKAGCIVVCLGARVPETIKRIAKESGTTIIATPHDTYTAARLINKSMPISYFMASEKLVSFHVEDYCYEIKEVMAKLRHRYFAVLDENEHYIGLISKRSFLAMDKKKVILVDHNERTQAVDGIEDADIKEIIDHHRIGSLETLSPVFFRNQPLGCTATIVYQIYKENNVEIDAKIAGLLCAAIISDTLMYRSPTCTQTDKAAAEELAKIAGIDVHEFAEAMFSAGSNLKNKTAEEIFYQDFKIFNADDIVLGIGQVSSMNGAELHEISTRVKEYMLSALEKGNVDILLFMLTNIIDESTELLFVGDKAVGILESAFHTEVTGESLFLNGIVSRKKQLAPVVIEAIQER